MVANAPTRLRPQIVQPLLRFAQRTSQRTLHTLRRMSWRPVQSPAKDLRAIYSSSWRPARAKVIDEVRC